MSGSRKPLVSDFNNTVQIRSSSSLASINHCSTATLDIVTLTMLKCGSTSIIQSGTRGWRRLSLVEEEKQKAMAQAGHLR